LTLELALLWSALAFADDAPAVEAPVEAPVDDDLTKYREDFVLLADRTIGTTATAVEFNWRRSPVQLAATGGFLTELNNFNSARVGGLVRLPTEGLIVELGVAYAHTWDTPSSELLALTPYRQPGRPSRGQVDAGVAVPLAEGVVTVAPRWFPAVQMVFNAYGGLRYELYPRAFQGLRAGQVAGAALSPALREEEISNLDRTRLDAMAVDPGRYGLVAGFGNDLYFKPGIFVSPRVTVSVPLLAGVSGTDLVFWADLSLAAGMAF
jgi:hypothetical protein